MTRKKKHQGEPTGRRSAGHKDQIQQQLQQQMQALQQGVSLILAEYRDFKSRTCPDQRPVEPDSDMPLCDESLSRELARLSWWLEKNIDCPWAREVKPAMIGLRKECRRVLQQLEAGTSEDQACPSPSIYVFQVALSDLVSSMEPPRDYLQHPIELLSDEKGCGYVMDREEVIQAFGAGPSVPHLHVYIDPGNAGVPAIRGVFEALSELHRAAGGAGLTFSKDNLGVFEMAGVTV